MYPFDDRVPISDRVAERAIRNESRTYVRESKGLSHQDAQRRAVGLLNRWGGTLGRNEPFYAMRYGGLTSGAYTSLDGDIRFG
jgi:hypothetical protein